MKSETQMMQTQFYIYIIQVYTYFVIKVKSNGHNTVLITNYRLNFVGMYKLYISNVGSIYCIINYYSYIFFGKIKT